MLIQREKRSGNFISWPGSSITRCAIFKRFLSCFPLDGSDVLRTFVHSFIVSRAREQNKGPPDASPLICAAIFLFSYTPLVLKSLLSVFVLGCTSVASWVVGTAHLSATMTIIAVIGGPRNSCAPREAENRAVSSTLCALVTMKGAVRRNGPTHRRSSEWNAVPGSASQNRQSEHAEKTRFRVNCLPLERVMLTQKRQVSGNR